jgi:hypothetical protein
MQFFLYAVKPDYNYKHKSTNYYNTKQDKIEYFLTLQVYYILDKWVLSIRSKS